MKGILRILLWISCLLWERLLIITQGTQCGQHFYKTRGSLESPNFPYHYPDNIDCWWSISVPQKYKEIQLHFKKFNVENPRWSVICFRDYVDVFQFIAGKRRFTGRYCGKKGSFNITSVSNRVDIRLKTNTFRSRKGFSLNWIASTGCGEIQEGDYGEIRSKDFQTSSLSFCKWIIKASDSTNSIILKIKKLKLEKNRHDCRRQFLSIKDGNNVQVSKFCNRIQPTTLVIKGPKAIITTKCKEFNSFKLEAEWQANKQKEKEPTCGISNIRQWHHRQRRLVGGYNVYGGSWPWAVRIRTLLDVGRFKFKQVICGGALISKNYVITAAHCVSFNAHVFKQDVMLGAEAIYDPSAVYIQIKRIIIHPKYTTGMRHDIALLELSKSATFGYRISPICLPQLPSVKSLKKWNSKSCWLGGWGKEGEAKPNSNFLQYLPVKLWLDCLRSSTNFCALYKSSKRGTCQGDSGGPLVCLDNEKGKYYIVGILSHGPSPCLSHFDTYVNIGFYWSWINKIMNSTRTEFTNYIPNV